MNEDKLRIIYDSQVAIGYELPPFPYWRRAVIFFYETDNGGFVLWEDPQDERVCWIQAHCPGTLPGLDVLRNCMRLAVGTGKRFIASEVKDKRVGRLLSIIGLEKLDNGLYSIQIN